MHVIPTSKNGVEENDIFRATIDCIPEGSLLSSLCVKILCRSLASNEMTEVSLKSIGCPGAFVLGMKIVLEVDRLAGSFLYERMTFKIYISTPAVPLGVGGL